MQSRFKRLEGARDVPILLVEDDSAIRRMLVAAFLDTEFRAMEAENGSEGLALVSAHHPEVIVLDLGLPDRDGVDLIKEIRTWNETPIIILSAEGNEDRKVLAFEAGADDYVTKPFGIAELVARLRTTVRRSQRVASQVNEPVIEVRNLKVDLVARSVWRSGVPVHLTPIEYKVLVVLAKHAGRVVTQRQILAEVWGDDYSEESQYLRIYVGYLRKKLEEDVANPTLILTEPRVGYRLQA